MRISRSKHIKDEELLEMTPMIDVVFQLLIFFLLSAKFIALEAQIQSYLPKDKGLSAEPTPQELVNVGFELQWIDEGPGRVVCRTLQYRDPATGNRQDVYKFGDVDATVNYRYGPGERARIVSFGSPDYPVGYIVPDYGEIERYLAYRKANYADPEGKGLPVTIDFDGRVPTGAVTVILDICERLGIKNFSLSAKELE